MSNETAEVDFFHTPLNIKYDAKLRASLSHPINEEAISAFWSELSRSKYDDLLNEVRYLRSQMRLNDWGYCVLLKKIGEHLYEGSSNEITLFIWFMLVKSGYNAKVGYNENGVYLLIPSENKLFGVMYFTLENKEKFYAVRFDSTDAQFEGSLFTYDGSYPGAEKRLSFALNNLPFIGNIATSRALKFTYGDKEYSVNVKVNRGVVDFFSFYPQTNMEVYFEAPASSDASASLLSAMKPIVQGKSEIEAVNILLRFVQTAFGYKTDRENFGREKPMFPDETLFYEFSDCEDRSVLFSYLVKHLLGLDVIGLDYPAHVATAVKFSNLIEGDAVSYRNQHYVICDPTYENANVGVCMPLYHNTQPNVIKIQ